MEEKKILWIVLSMSAFIAVIFGAAIYLYAPSKNQSTASSDTVDLNSFGSGTDIASIDPDMWSREPDKVPGYNAEDERSLNTTNITTNITFVNGGEFSSEEKNDNGESLDVSELTKEKKTTEKELPPELAKEVGFETDSEKQESSAIKKHVTENRTQEKNSAQNHNERKASSGVAERRGSLAPAKSQKQVSSAQKKTYQEKNTPSKTSAVKNTDKKKIKTSVEIIYWVQTASLSSRLNAEKVRDKLVERHMKVEIFTKETPSGLTHRVRVGPFKNNTEAEYWLKNIKNIKGFESSYISQERVKI